MTHLRSMIPYVALVVLALPAAVRAQPGTILLQDDFNRADSLVLGSPWTEMNENSVSVVSGSYLLQPATIEIESQSFTFRYSSQQVADPWACFNTPGGLCTNFGRPFAYAPLARPLAVLPAAVSFRFSPHAGERVQHEIGLMSAAAGFSGGVLLNPGRPRTSLGVELRRTSSGYSNSSVRIVKREAGTETELLNQAVSFQFEYGQSYPVEMRVEPDFSIGLSINGTDNFVSAPTTFGGALDQLYVSDIQGGDGSNATAEFLLRFDDVSVRQSPLNVSIDIKPGSDINSINLSSAGAIPVAILSSPQFDATAVKPESVALAGASVKLVGKSGKFLTHQEDVNGDGLLDLVCQVLTDQLQIVSGDSIAVLEAETAGNLPVRGEDSIRIVPD